MNRTLSQFNFLSSAVLIAAALIENIFFPSIENLLASLVLIVGWALIRAFVLTPSNLTNHPVSFLMILGLALFGFILPMPLTLLEGKPVTYNLRVPIETFIHHLIFVSTIVFTHLIYTSTLKTKNIFRDVLNKTDFYVEPTNRVIWLSALLGLGGGYYNYVIAGAWQQDVADRNITYHVISVLSQFIWMPVIMLFPRFRPTETQASSGRDLRYIIGYSLCVLVMAIISNWRTILFSGFFIFAGLFLFATLLRQFDLKKVVTPGRAMLAIVVCFLVAGPLVDMGYAMVAVRGARTNLPALEFLSETISVYSDDNLMSRTKKLYSSDGDVPTRSFAWDEEYLSNGIANRMVNLKISDNCLFYAEEVGYASSYMQDEILRQIGTFTPNIFLSLFNLDREAKIYTANYSIGDYLYSLAINNPDVLGSAVISSMPGIGMAIFGYWYIPLLIPMFLIIFLMFDSLVLLKENRVVFSYMFFVMFAAILNYFNDRHVYVFEFRFILRTYFETVILFVLTMKLIRATSNMLSRV